MVGVAGNWPSYPYGVTMDKWQFDEVVRSHAHEIMDNGHITISFTRTLKWVMCEWGWIIETTFYDEEETATVETLITYNGKTATLVHRHRFGPCYNVFKSYPRDTQYPIPCIVRLLPCLE